MRKSTLSFCLAALAVFLLLLSFIIKEAPLWISVVGLVLALVALILSPRGWKEKK